MSFRPAQSKTFDLDARFQQGLRAIASGSAKEYLCPLCSEHFTASPKLWQHAKDAHEDAVELTHYTDETTAKKSFIDKAIEKARDRAGNHKVTDKGLHSKQPSHDPKRYVIGQEEEQIQLPDRPSSAPEHNEVPGRPSGDIGHLALRQEKRTSSHEKPGYINNPRKRGAGVEFGSPSMPSVGHSAAPVNTRVRHAKTPSRNLNSSVDPRIVRQSPTRDSEFTRDTSGPIKPLWDPQTDHPLGKDLRRDMDQGHSNINQRRHVGNKHVSSFEEPVAPASDDRSLKPEFGQDAKLLHTSQHSLDGASNQPLIMLQDQRPRASGFQPEDDYPEAADEEPEMLLQPETRPISHEQLVVEVKGIYAGLVMVEAKCIDIDERQSTAAQEKDPFKRINLKNDQWQSLIALHKQLLHEHHDFFLASQHPSASPALSRLAAKYSMPARMWRHGIHAFLEVLRHRLPESLEHMLAFIYIAYSMMALLYETVPAFEDTWIECLGDLGRYRMAIEDDEPKDREVWSNVSRFWYNKASDKTPSVGRLYHHLAILARPYTWEQLSLYARSLTCIVPFESARGSIMTLFTPILQGKDTVQRRSSSVETKFIRAHAMLFIWQSSDQWDAFEAIVEELARDGVLDNYIAKAGSRFREAGVYAVISCFAALMEFGTPRGRTAKPILRTLFDMAKVDKQKGLKASTAAQGVLSETPAAAEDQQMDLEDSGPEPRLPETSLSILNHASKLTFVILRAALRRLGDKNVYPLVHVSLVFLWSIVDIEPAMKLFGKDIPWQDICNFLNSLNAEYEVMKAKDLTQAYARLESKDFPRPDSGVCRPLSEDFLLRGQVYTDGYHPDTLFSDAGIDDDERSLDLPSMNEPRVERTLWIGRRISSGEQYMRYDHSRRLFAVTDAAIKLNTEAKSEVTPIDVDSVMSDVGLVDSHHQAQDLVLSTPDEKSTTKTFNIEQFASDESKQLSSCSTPPHVSTPTKGTSAAKPAAPNSPYAVEPGDSIDTAMVDLSPGKDPPQRTHKDTLEPVLLTLPPPKFGDRVEVSPHDSRKADNFPADPNKVQIMERFDHTNIEPSTDR